MNLYLSVNSIVALLGGALVVVLGYWAWHHTRGRGRARAARQQLLSPVVAPDKLNSLSREFVSEREITVSGVLQVDGRWCFRPEDGFPVGASSYANRHPVDRRQRQLWLSRAEQLSLAVGNIPVVLRGPVLVQVGSRELASSPKLARLPGAAQRRLARTDPLLRPVSRPPLGDGIFRSLHPGDRVVARGVLRRTGGADRANYRRSAVRYELCPLPSGVIPVAYANGPRLRMSLRRMLLPAFGLVTVAMLVGGFIGSTDPDCGSDAPGCLLYGHCGSSLGWTQEGIELRCAPRSAGDCRRSAYCQLLGSCSLGGRQCLAASDADCRSATTCTLDGRCTADDSGRCSAELVHRVSRASVSDNDVVAVLWD